MPGPIGYTFIHDQIKARREARRASQQAGGDSAPVGDNGDKATAHEDVQYDGGDKGSAAAVGAAQVGAALAMDEEAVGKAGAPERTGVPRDPENARSKKRSYTAVLVAGFALAIDFTMSLMSIQPLFYLLSGPQSLYGLTFGCYDLTAMLFAPLFGLWTDRTRRFKPQILLGSLVNAAGNLLYAFTVLAGQWWIMLVSRLIAGMGAATLGIGSSYITQTTTSAQRQVKLGRYRITQNVARMVGPFIGYLFLGLPNVSSSSSTGLKLFNWYSVPGWCAFALVVLVAIFFAWAYVEPTEENEHLVKPEARDDSRGPPSPERVREFWVFAVSWLFLTFLIVMSATGFTSNLFGLAAGQYHLVTTQGENWRTYVGVGAGAAAAGILFRRMIRWVPHWWEERKIVLLSNWLQLLYWLLVIPYQGATWVPPDGLFYAATALAGFTVVINQASIETFFSKKLTQYADVVGDHVGKWMGAYFMCASGDQYWIGGCVLLHAIPMYAAMAGLQFCVNLACLYVIRSNWSWADRQPASAQSPALGADNGNGNGDNTLFKATSDGADGAAGQENASKVPF
ncbi:hypothetical protein COHA_008706 [Chlorella ohadii]|uniref:Uncharacterized protein n=1 Tax=Chlorella ohadii TaxID=2649997 RepID=A0AAD5DJE0_9CHLO|nr:hypothetical protein COHA_008706 [Chlorella ohadii]